MSVRILARTGAGACALVLCGAGWAAFAPAAGALSGVQTGYWSSGPAAPEVPAGGIEIGSNASGPYAVAAVRFSLAEGESSPVLTLKVAQAQPQSQVVLEACSVAAAAANWQPPPGGGPGALSAAPAANCSGGVASGAVAADGSTVTFDLGGIPVVGSVVDVVLAPGKVPSPAAGTAPGAPNDMYPTFDAAFQPVEASQITVTPGSSSLSSPSTPPPAVASSGGVAYPAPAPPAPPANAGVALPPATSTGAASGVAPVIAASPQPTNVASAAPALVTKKRNLRLLFGVAMLSSDLLFLLLWAERRLPGPGDRPLISIYDPPPLAS